MGVATEMARKAIEKLWSHLGALDDEVAVDRRAFFPDGVKGNLTDLKPADLKGRLDQALRGFTVPANAGLPDAKKWHTRLTDARDGLAAALSGHGEARGASKIGTAGLNAARERFLGAYNGVAKPLVRGLLAALGRQDEYDTFFKDLQVQEDGARATPATPPA